MKAGWDTAAERTRRGHAIEHNQGWRYKHTWVFERDHPDGWDFKCTQPEGWELNVDKTPQYGTSRELVEPGLERWPEATSGVMLVAYWRRKR